ncbi:hypothetical protein BGZ90_002775 [Linnemannia elongata]|nr:hypothetical protein BGZ90_002775 [Linnemannia elongata]
MTVAAKKSTVVLLPGDGVGPEVIAEAQRVLELVAKIRAHKISINFKTELIGGASIDAHGTALTDEALASCKAADAILLGAVGGPKWATGNPRPEQGLLALRKSLDLYANLRPCTFASDSLISHSPLKESIVKGVDFMMIRELAEVERVTRLAAALALQHEPHWPIHSIDKANVLASSRLWRKTVTDVIEKEYPQLKVDHHLVDSAAMFLVKNPRGLNGVILTENMFGDILSDEASVIPGSLGLLPSASLNGLPEKGKPCLGVYEPIHGSAPDIAGKGIANPVGTILSAAMLLRYSLDMEAEAVAVEDAVRKVLDGPDTAGYEFRTRDLGGEKTTKEMGDKILEVLEKELFGLNAAEGAPITRPLAIGRPAGRRGMTISEKIIAHNAIGLTAPGNVKPGDMGMDKTYDQMGRPSVYRNDRFWLAVDHTVDPSINHLPKPTELIKASTDFAKEAKLIDFYGANYSILHTEFYRERAQPGQMIIGADSHSCSAGAVGAFAVGLGAADVVMPLVTGETWFKVPETVEIRFINQPPFGIGGKDAILYVLQQLKRNTVAFERSVEYTGPGLKHLSCDARFALANMATEFGGIAGVCEADETTAAYIAKRKNPQHKNSALYFKADEDAEYAETHVIDLAKVESLVALYPDPDNCVDVDACSGTKLDGCFIGACTTAEEDLILAALVLEAGLKKGLVPALGGKRKVTPGSVPIVAKLRRLGLLKIYEQAGFIIGAPGCSYCIAVAADQAGEGEVWLSSQNRNFRNRMGKGAIGNLASAATVAASSFDMKIRNPRDLLDSIDRVRYEEMLEQWIEKGKPVVYSEPVPILYDEASADGSSLPAPPPSFSATIKDNIDTDAIIPAQFMPGTSDVDLGTHAFQFVKPEFRDLVKQGFDIVVGGSGFGSGSSREEAPRALLGAGVKAVIAKSYAFIYARNQPNMSLLGITLDDEAFYKDAQEGAEVAIDVKDRKVHCNGKEYPFGLSLMEERLLAGGGVTEMYKTYGKQLFRVATAPEKASSCGSETAAAAAPSKSNCGDESELAW